MKKILYLLCIGLLVGCTNLSRNNPLDPQSSFNILADDFESYAVDYLPGTPWIDEWSGGTVPDGKITNQGLKGSQTLYFKGGVAGADYRAEYQLKDLSGDLLLLVSQITHQMNLN